MILPIFAYGQPVLKKVGANIDSDYPNLSELLENMWDTMYHASGVGLAAPQIGLPIRIFLVDSEKMMDEGKESEGIKKVFINAEIIEESGELWAFEEGCLSIPKITGDVYRKEKILIKYFDEHFVEHTEAYDGMNARVIQHEYDHIEGKLFTEMLKPLKKRLVGRKLEAIKKGQVDTTYRMKFVKK